MSDVRKLHLGCGDMIKEGWINFDSRPIPGVDVVRDVLRGLPFEDNTFDFIMSINFMEHIPQSEVIWLMNEMWRVMKVGGSMQHIVPRAGTGSYFQDPTHLSHWTNETVKYFVKDHPLWKIYQDTVKPWRLVRNATSNLHTELIDFILEKC